MSTSHLEAEVSGRNLVKNPSRVTSRISKDIFVDNVDAAVYPCRLDFSDSKFQLTSIDGIEIVKSSAIKEIDLTDNKLEELNIEMSFTALRILKAPRNRLTTLHIHSRRLSQLHVSNNHLNTIPDLTLIPLIEVLDVSYNDISGSLDSLVKGERKLKKLLLDHNKFSFPSRRLIQKELRSLRQQPHLEELSLAGNPLCTEHRDYRMVTVGACPKIQILDGNTIERDDIAEALDLVKKMSDSEASSEEEEKPEQKKRKIFGLTIAALAEAEMTTMPVLVDECIAVLEKNSSSDMFLEEPSPILVDQLLRAFELNNDAGADLAITLSPNATAHFLIAFFRSLLEPPIPTWTHHTLAKACMTQPVKHKIIKEALKQAPPPNFQTVVRVCNFLHRYIQNPLVNVNQITTLWAELLLGKYTTLDSRQCNMIINELMPYSKYEVEHGDDTDSTESDFYVSQLAKADSRFSHNSHKKDDVSTSSVSASTSSSRSSSTRASSKSSRSKKSAPSEVMKSDQMKDNLLGILVRKKKVGGGVKVIRVIGGSPAEQSEIIDVHDKIKTINGKDVSAATEIDVNALLASFTSGQKVEIEVERVVGAKIETEKCVLTAKVFVPNEKKTIRAEDAADFSSGYESSTSSRGRSSASGTKSTHTSKSSYSSSRSGSTSGTPSSGSRSSRSYSGSDTRSYSSGSGSKSSHSASHSDSGSYSGSYSSRSYSKSSRSRSSRSHSSTMSGSRSSRTDSHTHSHSSRSGTPRDSDSVTSRSASDSTRPPARPVTTKVPMVFAIEGLQQAPKAQQWLGHIDHWADTLDETADAMAHRTKMLSAWRLRINTLLEEIQMKPVGVEATVSIPKGRAPAVKYEWDDEDLDGDDEADVSVQKLQQLSSEVEVIKTENVALRKVLREFNLEMKMEQPPKNLSDMLQDIEEKSAKLSELLQREKTRADELQAAHAKGKRLAQRLEADISSLVRELDMDAASSLILANAGANDLETEMRFVVGAESAERDAADIARQSAAMEALIDRAAVAVAQAKARRADLRAQLQDYRDRGQDVARRRDTVRSGPTAAVEGEVKRIKDKIREKNDEICKLAARITHLEKAFSLYL